MKRIIPVILIMGCIFLAGSCATKRWSEGDPRAQTPIPTPEVIATAVIGIGVEAGSNTTTGNAP